MSDDNRQQTADAAVSQWTPKHTQAKSELAAPSGSEAKPKSIAEWFRYLTETGNFNAYKCDGSAKCKEIEAGFGAWKATQVGKAKPLNDGLQR